MKNTVDSILEISENQGKLEAIKFITRMCFHCIKNNDFTLVSTTINNSKIFELDLDFKLPFVYLLYDYKVFIEGFETFFLQTMETAEKEMNSEDFELTKSRFCKQSIHTLIPELAQEIFKNSKPMTGVEMDILNNVLLKSKSKPPKFNKK